MGKITEAQARATAKWEAANYDRVLTRLPRGTKERITATGATLNGFIVAAVLARLEALEADSTRDDSPG